MYRFIEGSLEVKLPTIWTDEKQRWEESEKEKRREEERRSKRESLRGSLRGVEKVGSLKRRVRSHVVRWEMANCTPLWREAHFEVKMYKAPRLRSTFRSCDVEKCAPLWREAHFEVKMHKAPHARAVEASFCVAGARDCAPCQKWEKREGFVAFPKTMASVGHLKKICKDTNSVAGAVQETCSSEMLGGEGADFLRGVAWSIRSSVLGRWLCVTGAALRMTWHHFFVAGAVLYTGGAETSRNALVRGRQLYTQRSVFEGSLAELFHFWCCQLRKLRTSRRFVSLLMLSSSKIEEVSQNSFVFDVVQFKSWGSLAELLRFWCCQVQKLRKFCRIASFSNLQIDR